MKNIQGYTISETLQKDQITTVYRCIEKSTGEMKLVKVLNGEYPDSESIKKFYDDFNIVEGLNIDGVLKYHSIIDFGHSKAIVMEDPGGILLRDYFEEGDDYISRYVEIFIKIAAILDDIHKNNIIHKNLTPDAIIVNRASGEVKITDFSVASQVRKEVQDSISPKKLDANPFYISPEQSGRMNRSVDYRSDNYTLGIIMYEKLTGSLPFLSDDTMQIIHHHIAKIPDIPSDVNDDIPRGLSDIIMKMLSKTAEDRYQSSYGLIEDLKRFSGHPKIINMDEVFKAGTSDFSDTLEIPEKVYGREHEIEKILNITERIIKGKAELLLIAGDPGVGKSFLIDEVQKLLLNRNAYFISGKCDQFRPTIPYDSIAQAFKDFIKQILMEEEESIASWKELIVSELRGSCRLICEVIPELELITGTQPPLPELTSVESYNRFNYAFLKFIKVLTEREEPLVIFLDDLQWADEGTLNLITSIITGKDISHCLIIGAYRDHEIGKSHPLALMMEELNAEGTGYEILKINPLKVEHINRMISDTLIIAPQRTGPLAEIVANRSGGNPFFIKEFLIKLYKSGCITRNIMWTFDLEKIKQLEVTESSVDLIAERILRLSDQTREILKAASCIGIEFSEGLLPSDTIETGSTFFDKLKEAINEGLVIKFQDRMKFSHDKVREAVYNLLNEKEKSEIHYKIGNHLLSRIEEENKESNIYLIVNQFNHGIERINDKAEKVKLAELNLRAGLKSKSSNSYFEAIRFLENGLSLLSPEKWSSHYSLTLSLYTEAGETLYLLGEHEKAEIYYNRVLEKARSPIDKVRVYEVKIINYTVMHRHKEALDLGIRILKDFGYTMPKRAGIFHIIKELLFVKKGLYKKSNRDLLDLPEVTDPRIIAIERILMACSQPCYTGIPGYLPIVILKLLRLSLRYGNSIHSSFSFMTYSMILCGFIGNINSGYRYGELSLKLMEKYSARELKPRVFFIFGTMINHWKNHFNKDLDFLLSAYKTGTEVGEFSWASYSINHYFFHQFFMGKPLAGIISSIDNYYEGIKSLKQLSSTRIFQLLYQVMLNLSGHCDEKLLIRGEFFDEEVVVDEWIKSKEKNSLCFYYTFKQILYYFYGKYEDALKISQENIEYLDSAMSMIFIPVFYYYYSLSLLASSERPGNKRKKKKYLKQVRKHLKMFEKWAEHSPVNYKHKLMIIRAGFRSAMGRDVKSILGLYEEAILLAQEGGFIQDEAVACERAGQYCLSVNMNRFAGTYLGNARNLFLTWGGKNYVDDFQKRYPQVFQDDFHINEKQGVNNQDKLDISTVIKSSHVMSGEIILKNLVERLMEILIENAGASRGLLILQGEMGLNIEAEYSIDNKKIRLFKEQPVDDYRDIPHSIINYSKRALETVVLNSKKDMEAFEKEPYFKKETSRSIISMPLIKQKSLVGLLYLENNLTFGAFPVERIELLKLLSTQAAISLENARLFARAQKAESEMYRQYEEIQGQYEEMESMNEELEQTYEELINTNIDLNNEREILDIFKKFAEASGHSLGMTDLKGNITYVNSAFCKITGEESAGNLIGVYLGDYYTEENKKVLMDRVLPDVLNKDQVIVEMMLLSSNEDVRHTIQNIFLIRDNKNDPINFAFVITDITEMKNAEKALRESEERYRLLVETMNEGLVVVDERDRITYCNSRFCEMIQNDYNYTIGRYIGDFLDEKNREKVKIESARRKEGHHNTYELEFKRSDSQVVPVSVSPRPIFNSDGKYAGSFAIITDISYRKRTEYELLKTSKIESLGVFAGGLAHDFNNFLTAIIGNISFLKINMDQDSENFEILKDAQKAAVRAKNLTQQLLTFSKGGKPVKKIIPIENLLKESASFVLSGSNIILKFNISDDMWNAEIDEGQISQVFHNLVINARQAMPGGGVIEISVENISISREEGVPLSAGNYIKIKFQDNGPGIKSENLNNIFDPFFTTKEEGSGLGLAITYSIIKKHNGHISVESNMGTGTVFTLYLPAKKNIPEKKTGDKKMRYRGSGRILVMDDDKSIINTVSKMLKYFGFSVDSATNGEEAINKYKKALAAEEPYRIVILDLTIPGKMGGREAIEELKKLDPGIKAVVSSGYSNDPVMANYSEYGFSAVVKKPFIIEELEEVLSTVLEN